MATTATCKCGAIHIEIDKIMGAGMCHCLSCRKTTSSAFSINAVVEASAFHLVSGTPKTYQTTGGTGVASTLNFCGDCGSAMWLYHPPMPDLRVVKAGVLDGDDAFAQESMKPMVEQFTKRRAPWLCAAQGAAQFEGQQTAKDLEQLKSKLEEQTP